MHGSRLIAAAVRGIAAWACLGLCAHAAAQDSWRAAPAVFESVEPAGGTAAAGGTAPASPATWQQQPLEEQPEPADAPRRSVAPLQTARPAPTAAGGLAKPPREALPLKPPSRQAENAGKTAGGLPSLVTVAGSLAIVLGLFFALVWFLKRGNPKSNALLPQEVVEVLGRAPLDGRQQLHLLRIGHKLLLVSVTPAGAETLTEITEPLEVDRLAGLCMQSRPNSATAVFRQVFQQFSEGHAAETIDDRAPREEVRRG